MNLIFLYGPPAAGKLTIAKGLHKQLSYKLLDNHKIINLLTEVFDWEMPSRRMLVREFRLRMLEEAAKNNINLIITVGTAGEDLFTYFDKIVALVETYKAKVCYVQITANKETLLERVENEDRKKHGKNFGKEKLREIFEKYPQTFHLYKENKQLTIDTSNMNPEEAVKKIIEHYKL